MKIDRLIAITMILINKKKITAKELANYFEVSVRTIQRDMDHLTMAGVPLFSDVGKNGGYSIVENYKMDKNFLNTNEADMLIALLENIETIVPYDEAKSMTNKLRTIFPDKGCQEKMVFSLVPNMKGSRFREFIGCLSKAREKQQKVTLTYIDADFNESIRVLCPYRLVMMGTTWYVYGFCDERKDFRLFKISRIIECQLLDELFDLLEMPIELPWESMTDGSKKSTPMILEIDSCLKGQIPEYFDYQSCKVLEDKIIVTIAFPVDEWLYSLLLSLVPHIRVVEPKWVKEEMIRRMELGLLKMK